MRIGAPLPIKFFDAPKEGRRATPVNLSFPDDDGKTADFSLIQFQGEQCRIQTLFADNSANDIALTIQTNTVMQVITVPPKSQGYFPVLSTQPLKLTILSSGSTSVANIFALNFSVPPACWGIASGSGQASHVIVDSGSIDVANFPAVQPVSQSGTWIIDAAQSGAWNVGVNNFPNSFGASQIGAWDVGINNLPVERTQSHSFVAQLTNNAVTNFTPAGSANYNQILFIQVYIHGYTCGSFNQVAIFDGNGNGIWNFNIPAYSTPTDEIVASFGIAAPAMAGANDYSASCTFSPTAGNIAIHVTLAK